MQARMVIAPLSSEPDGDDERAALRRDRDRLRIQLALANAQVSEAQQQRERALANLENVTSCLVECQGQLQEAIARDDAHIAELNELRTLVDEHQDELQVVTEARRQVQGLCEELRAENERLRAELAGLATPPKPEPQVARPMALVNVAR